MDLPIRRLFDPSALPERDARGFCRHPDLADPRWFVHPSSKLLDDHFFAQCGYEIRTLWFLASATTEAIDAYTSTSSVRSWEPTAPAGEGWTLLMIGDTTEGPAAFFVRERSAVEGGLSPTLSRVTNLLGLLQAVRQRLERDTPRGFEGVAPELGGEHRELVSRLDAAIDEVEAADRTPCVATVTDSGITVMRGDDVVIHLGIAPALPDAAAGRELVRRLRDTPNWLKESLSDWTCAATRDRAPMEAADYIEALLASRPSCAAPRVTLPDELKPQLREPINPEWRAERRGFLDGWNKCRARVIELNPGVEVRL